MECTHSSAIPSYATALIIFAGLLVFELALLIFILLPSNPLRKNKRSEKLLNHAIVTGGSSGIGLAIALELVQRNCKHVSIIARGKEKLNEAKEELEQCAKSIGSCTSVSVHSVNVGNFEAVKEMAEEICNDQVPPLTMIFNVAGTSVSGTFLDTDPSEFERLMNINYIGSVNTTKAFLPHMKPQYNENGAIISQGIVVLTSSVAGQVGVYGFSAYSPTKFALRGLAEVLQMELSRDNINVQLAFPPDTDTPGYKEEQIGKPEETHLISEVAGLFKPEE
jgi:3-dehydrosphinganine reductase